MKAYSEDLREKIVEAVERDVQDHGRQDIRCQPLVG